MSLRKICVTPKILEFFSQNKIYFSFDGSPRLRINDQIEIDEHAIVEPYSAIFAGLSIPQIGAFSYTWSAISAQQKIGRYCSIAADVRNLGLRHTKEAVSTSPLVYERDDQRLIIYQQALKDAGKNTFPYYENKQPYDYAVIEHDVWIGEGALLGRNITIGTGAIVGARAVVTKDIPPYAIVAGVPAVIKGYRFSPEMIDALLTSEWWNYSFTDFGELHFDAPEQFLEVFHEHKERGDIMPMQSLGKPLVAMLHDPELALEKKAKTKALSTLRPILPQKIPHDSTGLIWLSVGGCPRSGTTSLGAALNKNAEISLLHEYDAAKFWEALNSFFTEETRLQNFKDFSEFVDMVPSKQHDIVKFAKALFSSKFNKSSHIIGTKFPGLHLWLRPEVPEEVIVKEIHITRNPFDTVLSYAKKNVYDGLYRDDQIELSAKRALMDWAFAYSYAISRYHDPDFFHIFYDEVILDASIYESDLAYFLGIDSIDLSSMDVMDSNLDVRQKFKAAGLEVIYEKLATLFQYEEWYCHAKTFMANREDIVFGNKITFGMKGIDQAYTSHYTIDGFYPAEVDGIWTKGQNSSIQFKPGTLLAGQVVLSIDITWVTHFNEEWPQVIIYLNDKKIADMTIEMLNNGTPQRYSFVISDFYDPIVDIRFEVQNPFNPKLLGISDDDRDLALMIQVISLTNL
jgi:acetyltransferase-like isoleucine patch superfamily enzyme